MKATDFENIKELVSTSGAPFYKLSKRDNEYKALQFVKTNTTDENPDVVKSWQEIKSVCEMLLKMNSATVFELELMTSKSANGSGKLGPFTFMLDPSRQNENSGPTAAVFNSEKESEVMQRGYQLAKEHNQPLFELMRREGELTMKTLLLEQEKKTFEDFKRSELERLSELEKKYESRKKAGLESLENFATANIPKFLKAFGGGSNKGLGGVETEDVEEVLTVEEEAINDIASNLHAHYTDGRLNLARIQKIGQIANGAVEKFNKPSTQSNEQ